MPIHYDIETDELYLEGYKKGYEQGYKQGYEQGYKKGYEQVNEQAVINMLKREQFTLRDIVEILNVSEEFVLNIAQRLGLKVIY